MTRRIYELKEEVVKEIVKIDQAMERILYVLDNDWLDQFPPWVKKMFRRYRHDIAAYGGLLFKRIKWEREDYLNGEDLPIKVPRHFKPASMKKASNE